MPAVKYNPEHRKGTSIKTSYIIWGAWAAAFVALELPAAFTRKMPYRTLSTTTHDLIKRSDGWASVAIVGGLSILAVHLVAPQVFESAK